MIETPITKDNAIEMWKAAELYDLNKLKAVALKYMEGNWQSLKTSYDLKKLPNECLVSLIDHIMDAA